MGARRLYHSAVCSWKEELGQNSQGQHRCLVGIVFLTMHNNSDATEDSNAHIPQPVDSYMWAGWSRSS